MNEHPVLGQIALGYCPMIDRHRAITALRLTVFPVRPDEPIQADALLALLAQAWPAGAGRLSLNIASEALLEQLLQANLPPHMMLEVPAFIAAAPAQAQGLLDRFRAGNTLLIKGRPLAPLPRELLPCFAYSIIDLADERRDGLPPPGGVSRNIPHVQDGVHSLAEMNDAFARGALAVLGWPIDEPVQSSPTNAQKKPAQPEAQAILELINRVDRGDDIDRLEAVMKADPTMAFKLIRYINSPVFGLRVEISSFRHAIMMLGYQRLKRWLVLLLANAGRDPNQKPVIYAAVRRGLLMEELGRDSGCDDDRRGELFICGVFSLLDRLLQRSFSELLSEVPASEAVRAALIDGTGPHQPYLALVQAIESGILPDIRACAEALMMGQAEVNAVTLRALAGAGQLD